MLRRTLSLAPLALVLFLACGGDDDDLTGNTSPACTPGQTLACACPGTTVPGAQTCQPGGTFGACAGCPGGNGGSSTAGASGSTQGGSSGTSGQGGSSGTSGQGGAGGNGGAGAGGTAGSGGAAGAGNGGVAGDGGGSGQGGAGQSGAGGVAGNGGASGSAGGGAAGGGAAGVGGSAGSGGSGGAAGSGGGAAGAAGSGAPGWPATCAEAAAQGTTVGCEFWAVDLDNEPESGGNNAAAEPWGLVLANSGTLPATVTLEINDGAPGQAPQVKLYKQVEIAAGSYFGEAMPSREVDGSKTPGDPAAPGTFLSSAAFRVRSTRPITAHQFNTATNAFSNDASMLLPTHALGINHRVLGWRPANPVAIPGFEIPGIPDHAYLTVVGTAEGTTVKVTPAWKIKAGGSIPFLAKGSTYEAKLGPFDVLNLETAESAQSDGVQGGELSGSQVTSDKPVAVFFGNERSTVTGGADAPKPPGWTGDTCCTDHMEEQIPPTSALGTRFAIARSPVRSAPPYVEPDVIRVVAADSAVTVKTSLGGASQQFNLQPGEVRDLWTTTDMTLESSGPVLVAQLLVAQDLIAGVKKGDPSLMLVPDVGQFLPDQAVPMPISWSEQYLAITYPAGATVKIDGKAPVGCESQVIGVLDGTSYEALRCPVAPDLRRVTADKPVGVAAYGYGPTGSYAVAGAARLKK